MCKRVPIYKSYSWEYWTSAYCSQEQPRGGRTTNVNVRGFSCGKGWWRSWDEWWGRNRSLQTSEWGRSVLDKWSGENAVRIEGMVWKREIASWKEGLADKRREEKGKESHGGWQTYGSWGHASDWVLKTSGIVVHVCRTALVVRSLFDIYGNSYKMFKVTENK